MTFYLETPEGVLFCKVNTRKEKIKKQFNCEILENKVTVFSVKKKHRRG